MNLLYQTERTLIFYSPAKGEQSQCLIKVLNSTNPTTNQVAQFYKEWDIVKNLDLLNVRKVIEKTNHEGKPALRLEYVAGESLKKVFDFKKTGDTVKVSPANNLEFFLNIAVQIAHALGEFHQQKIIHKDICPDNILLEKQTGTIKIIDFGLATSLNLKTTYLGNPERIQGNLHYISPEQSGRMNRTLDYRSDLYSFGVTLYELLTGRLPFEKEDPLELVHCHLAVTPVPPLEYLPTAHTQNTIYQVLSRIVLKLLNKNAEDRYQSAFGLKSDLETCLSALKKGTTLINFKLGLADFSEKFQIPQKLYGRTKELAFLVNAYKKVSLGGSQLLLVSGYSGVGKSALVYEIHKPLTENRGYFIEGKFDQFQRNIPYYAWIQAFDNFVQLLLTENQVQLESWKTRFLAALGGQGKVLTDLLPSLIKIIGVQPDLPELSPKQNQNRFNTVFAEFVKTIAQKEHPLFIFIDDWQWTDVPSLDLLEKLLVEIKVEYLLIAGAYRNNEVAADHPFAKTLTTIKQKGKTAAEIHLKNLQQEDINNLIAATLKCPLEYCQPLSKLIYHKTNGNAFFLRQMLQSLHEKEAIKLKYDARIGMRWDWDMQEIERLKISDNVVELMVEKAQQLPESTRRVLELAACIGTLFPVSMLSLIYQKSEKETYKDLQMALEEGLVVPSNEQYTFSHDRIQQAVYSLIPKREKGSFHYRIGKSLLENRHKNENIGTIENVFDIVNQLNYGLRFIKKASEKKQLTQLNLQAGIQAKRSIAYDSALHYLRIGHSLLKANSWEKNYELTFGIYRHLAEAESLSLNNKVANRMLQTAYEQAQTLKHQIEIAEYQIWLSQLNSVGAEGAEGIAIAKRGLALCGITFPKTEKTIKKAISEKEKIIEQALAKQGMATFLHLPPVKEVSKKMAFKLLPRLVFVCGLQAGRDDFYKLAVLSGIQISLEYGVDENMPVILAHYSSLLAENEQFKQAYEIGEIALELVDNYPDFHAKPQFLNRIAIWSLIYGRSITSTLPLLEKGIQIGRKNGNYVDTMVCQYDVLLQNAHQGKPGQAIIEFADKLLKEASFKKFISLELYVKVDQSIHLLLKDGAEKHRLKNLTECQTQFQMQAPNLNTPWIGLDKMMQHFWLREFREVLNTLDNFKDFIQNAATNIKWADHFFFKALAILSLQKTFSNKEKNRFQKELIDCRRKIRLMSEACADNFLHKHLLIEAEIAKLETENWQPAKLYQQAIQAAKDYEFTHIEALANELCAKFWHELGQFTYAQIHFKQAYQCYQRWEAFAVAKKLTEEFPSYFSQISEENRKSSSSSTTVQFDLESLLKASHILSGEIVLSNLIAKMLPIVMENAGAEKVSLIAVETGELELMAQAKVGETVDFSDNQKMIDSANFSVEILNYVANSLTPLVLDNAATADQFAHDLYIQRVQPKSVLCFPIFRKEQLSHLFYMENNLATGIFTAERLTILQSLSAQIGISIENALLYERQEKVRAAYSKFVPHPFLKILGHKSILDVKLGDQTQQEITVLFSDIRAYTSLSETMTPSENFNFLNAYLRRIAPAIKENEGFVSQYYGDGIMALFLNNPADAVRAAVEMQDKLSDYNEERRQKGRQAIKIGMGIHTGLLMLGILGEKDHQQATVVSDAVNTAARLEGLTKYYHSNIIITADVLAAIDQSDVFQYRFLGKVLVKGKSEIVAIYEIFNNDVHVLKDFKHKANPAFQKGLNFYFKKDFIGAITHFKKALEEYPNAPIIQRYFQKSAELITQELPSDWTGAEVMSEK